MLGTSRYMNTRMVNGMPLFMNRFFNERGLRFEKRRRMFRCLWEPIVARPVNQHRPSMEVRASLQRQHRRKSP